nr:putative MO25-like protein At5g47540 [Ipomoea batatas]GMD21070.1 putative MO25-like protein At5g47540 [Ipomoea batatas]
MTRYVSSRDNLRILMNLLRESSKSIQIEAFHVFKDAKYGTTTGVSASGLKRFALPLYAVF